MITFESHMNKIDSLANAEEQYKMLFMWVKQDKIKTMEFIKLSRHIAKRESENAKKQIMLDSPV